MTDLPTTSEVAAVGLALTDPAALERFVEELPAEQVAPFLARIMDAKVNLSALERGLTTRLILAGQTGQKWVIGGAEYGLYGSQPKGFRSIVTLFENLRALGVPLSELAASVTDARVTDLRKSAEALANRERSADALALIEGERYNKGDRGAPRFQVVKG